MFYIFCYVTGSIMILLSLLNFMFPKRKITLFFKASLDCVAIFNSVFILLATENKLIIVGIATNTIATIRDILYFNRNKTKVLDHIAWPIGFSFVYLISLIFTYQSWISIIPVVGSVISTLTLYANNQKITKFGALVGSGCYLAYYAILIPSSDILTVFSLVSSSMSLLGTIIGILIIYKRQKQIVKMNKI